MYKLGSQQEADGELRLGKFREVIYPGEGSVERISGMRGREAFTSRKKNYQNLEREGAVT